MKKIIYYFFLYIVFCLLQFSFGKYINILGIFPNFILIVTVYFGLSKGVISAQLMGFLFGLTWDVFSMDVFGVRAIMFTVIGYFVGMLSRNFNRDRIFTKFIMVFFSSIAYCLGFSFFYYILHDSGTHNFGFVTVIGSIKIIITVFISPVVFYILDFADKET
jgi:rod shape-determining protein MreD